MNLKNIVKRLKAEKVKLAEHLGKIEAAITALDSHRGPMSKSEVSGGTRRKMSAAARRNISLGIRRAHRAKLKQAKARNVRQTLRALKAA